MNPNLNVKFNKPTDLDFLFENYLTECQYSKQLRPRIIKGYREVFSIFQKLLPDVKETKDLHAYLMNEFYRLLNTRKRIVGRDTIKVGVKPSTIRTYYNKLIAFFSWLENNNYIEKGSFVKKKRYDNRSSKKSFRNFKKLFKQKRTNHFYKY